MTLHHRKSRQWDFRRPPPQTDYMTTQYGSGNSIFEGNCLYLMIWPKEFPGIGVFEGRCSDLMT